MMVTQHASTTPAHYSQPPPPYSHAHPLVVASPEELAFTHTPPVMHAPTVTVSKVVPTSTVTKQVAATVDIIKPVAVEPVDTLKMQQSKSIAGPRNVHVGTTVLPIPVIGTVKETAALMASFFPVNQV